MNRTPFEFFALLQARPRERRQILDNLTNGGREAVTVGDFTVFFAFDTRQAVLHADKRHPKYADYYLSFSELADLMDALCGKKGDE